MLVQRMVADVGGDAAGAAAVMQSCGACSPVLVLAWPPTLGTMR